MDDDVEPACPTGATAVREPARPGSHAADLTGAFCIFDACGCIREASPAAEAVLGAPPAGLAGRPLGIDAATLRALDGVRDEVQRTGNVLRCRFTPPGGAPAQDCRLAPIRAGDRSGGAVEGVVCTFEELPAPGDGVPDMPVDPRSALFAHAPIGVGLAAMDGSWLEINPALCAMTGLRPDELRTTTLQDLSVLEDRHRDHYYLRQLQTGTLTGYQIEKRWRRAAGREVDVEVSVSCVERAGADGGDRLVVQVRDVSAAKEAEARTRLLTDLIECSADAIWARDGDGEVVYWNRAAAGLLGFDASDLVGQRVRAELPTDRVAETAHVLAVAAGGRSVGPLDTVRRHKDGHEVEVSVTVSPIHGPDGALLGFASVARDLAERRADELRLRAAHDELQRRAAVLDRLNAQLRRSNEDLQQFSHAAAHDLSEPLRDITGHTQRFAQTWLGRLDEEADLLLEFIIDATVRMRQLLDSLLLYSRLDSRPSTPAEVALDEVVGDVVGDLGLRIAGAGATVEVDPLPAVEGDRAQLALAVRHLVVNALTFRSVAAPPLVRISGTGAGDHAEVHVDDNGPGIEPRHRDRVFRMFDRLPGRDDHEGTGIGLALVKRIAERHRGAVAVDDSPLGGARITLTLPVPGRSDPPATRDESDPGGPARREAR